MMKTDLTIQEVAALTNLSVHTLHYYERIGLLDPVNCASSGHRRYCADNIAWIEFLIPHLSLWRRYNQRKGLKPR